MGVVDQSRGVPVGLTGKFVGPYQVIEPIWVPEAGTWYRGEGADGAPVLIRVATDADRAPTQAQRDTLRRITDPRVPAVLAKDESTGSFAATYAIGTPLLDAIEQRTEDGGDGVVLTPATLVDVLLEIGRALQAAHSVGVVHGSLDPDRVLFGPDGRIWMFGFGSGVEPGTAWLPPEVARGERATTATDQWSLAAIGTGLVLGHAIWPWHDPGSLGTPGGAITVGDCSALVASIHDQWPALGRVLGRALSPAAADRYPSVGAFVHALQDLANLAGGSSDRRALGAHLWSRRALQRGTPVQATPPTVDPEVPFGDRPTRAEEGSAFHRAPTAQLETPLFVTAPSRDSEVPASPPPPTPPITRVARLLVGILVLVLVAAVLSRLS